MTPTLKCRKCGAAIKSLPKRKIVGRSVYLYRRCVCGHTHVSKFGGAPATKVQ